MLTTINSFLKRFKINARRPRPLSVRGQVALILILIIAIVLIMFAVVLNLGKIAQIKVITTVASNTSAAYMGSLMASYAENLYQVQLGGEDEVGDDLEIGKWNGIFAAVLTFLLIVLSVIAW